MRIVNQYIGRNSCDQPLDRGFALIAPLFKILQMKKKLEMFIEELDARKFDADQAAIAYTNSRDWVTAEKQEVRSMTLKFCISRLNQILEESK